MKLKSLCMKWLKVNNFGIIEVKADKDHIHLLYKEKTFWGDGYFACSTGLVSKDIFQKYIQTQG